MPVAVLSDIHGNLHALESVLAAVAAAGIDEIWCLGDTVGYGPRPNECCAEVERRSALTLAGNHDLVVLGLLELDDFSGDAGAAARWTQQVLNEESRAFLTQLAPSAHRPGVDLYHGSPRDPVWDYVLSEEAAWWSLRVSSVPLLLVGHSHVALALRETANGVAGGLAPSGAELELSRGRWLLNPGSVGQPRDGDPRAAWLWLDLDGGRARFHRVDYDIPATQAEMRAAGLPRSLAARLSRGD